MNNLGKTVRSLFCLTVVTVAISLLFSPQVALAKEVTQTVDSTMTVELQQVAAKAQAVTPSTGDFMPWVLLLVVLFAVAFAYLARRSYTFMSEKGAHAKKHDSTTAKFNLLLALIASVLLIAFSICSFATKSFAYDKVFDPSVTCTSHVLVDESGNVVDSEISVKNTRDVEVNLSQINAPEGFDGWNADISGKTVDASAELEGAWDGSKISDDILSKLKSGDGGLTITFSSDVSFDVTYDFSEVSVEVSDVDAEGEDFVYCASQISPEVSAEDLVEGEDYEIEYGENVNAGKDAGTVIVRGIGFFEGEQNFTFDIEKKQIDVTWQDTVFTYDREVHLPVAVANDVCEGDEVLPTVAGEQTNAGTYVATASIDEDNYEFADDQTTEFVINKKPITASWEGLTFVYDKGEHAPVATANDVCEGDEVLPTVEGQQVNTGTYIATATIDEANYEFAEEQSVEFVIEKKPITASWSGTVFIYDKTTHAPVASADDVCEGDEVLPTVSGEQTNAGSYTAVATIEEDNYEFADEQKTGFIIEKKQISTSWTDTTFTYDKTPHIPKAFADDVCEGDEVLTSVAGEQTNAGTYTAVATIREANYEFAEEQKTDFTIKKKPISASWSGAVFTYDKTTHAPVATANDVCEGDEVLTSVAGEQTNAGTYTAVATIQEANYEFAEEQKTDFTINKKPVTVSWNNTSFVYDKTSHVPSATVNDVCDGDEVLPTVSGEQTNVGEYEAFATINEANYVFSTEQKVKFRIGSKAIKIKWSNTSFTYDKTPHVPTATLEDVEEGDTVKVSVTGERTNAGNYEAFATIEEGNYVLDGEQKTSFTIAKKPITVSWNNTSFTYDKSEHAPNPVANDVYNGDTVVLVVMGKQRNAGEYMASVSIDADNYVLDGEQKTSFTIHKKKIDVSWSDLSFTYDGSPHKPVAVANDVCAGDNVLVRVAGEKTDAGEYESTASIDETNYEFEQVQKTSFTIGKKSVSIDWSNTTLTYDQTYQAPTATVSGVCDGDEVIADVSGEQKNAGKYEASASITSNNYVLTDNLTTEFVINQKALTVTWYDTSCTYDRSYHSPKATLNGICGSDMVVLSVGKKRDAGTYDVVASINEKNYKFEQEQKTTFTINPKPITVTWEYTTFTYDGEAHVPTAIANEVCTGDTVSISVTGEKTDAGTYVASASISENNYVFNEEQKANFIINKKQLSATWPNLKLVYNGGFQAPIPEVAGVLAEDNIHLAVNGGGTNAGVYEVEAVIDEANYEFSTPQKAMFEITKKPITVFWSDTTFTYDGSKHVPTASPNDVCEGDSVSVSVSGEKTDAGSYEAVASIKETNYAFPYEQKVSFKINPRGISNAKVEFEAGALTYNGSLQGKTIKSVTVDNMVLTDGRDYTLSGNTAKDVGSYTAKICGVGNFTGEYAYSFEIVKKQISVEWSTDTNFTYDGKSHAPTATLIGVSDGDSVSIEVSGAQTKVGTYSATVKSLTGESVGNYELPKTIPTTSFTISKRLLEIEWSGKFFTYDGQEHKPSVTMTGNIAGDDVSVNVTGGQTEIGKYTAVAAGLSGTSADNYQLQFDGRVYDFRIYYKYWLAPSYKMTTANSNDKANVLNPAFVSEESEIKKTPSQIESDVASIYAGNQTVIDEYKSYMKNDNYHLYSVYFGYSADEVASLNETNEYVEFRIIDVGSHDDDGSALTFQATHVLPSAYIYHGYNDFDGGWPKTSLRAKLQDDGEIVNYFPSEFVTDMKKVTKKTMFETNKTTITTSSDKMWIPSFVEVYSSTEDGYKGEGTQYAYYSSLGIKYKNDYNPSLILYTRAGNPAGGAFSELVGGELVYKPYWKLRSPNLTCVQDRYLQVDGYGMTYELLNMTTMTAVSPCFCF